MSAIKHLKPLNKSLKGFSRQIKSENVIFTLATKFTPWCLIGASILLGTKEYWGKPIACITSLPKNVVNTYCWISSTFTMQDFVLRETGTQAAQPGIYTPDSYSHDGIESKWIFHNYYQWVVFMLFFLAGVCYLPKYIWKSQEKGKLKAISSILGNDIFHFGDNTEKNRKVINYLTERIKLNQYYALAYWICEFLTFILIIMQTALIDTFLGGEFWQYGFKVLEFVEKDQVERVDPAIYVFPRMTKCNFHKFGPSGTLERHDSYCLLAQNILNEKIFIFIWFWYFTLATLLATVVLYRVLLCLCPTARIFILQSRMKGLPYDELMTIHNHGSIGNWWLLYLVSYSVDYKTFKEIIAAVAKDLEKDRSQCSSKTELDDCNGHYPMVPPLQYQSSVV